MADELTIREVAARTGVNAATLRMWEQRFGFPEPMRLESGHRRYSEEDVERVRRVARDRAAGLSIPAAIERARSAVVEVEPSVYAGIRRRRPDLIPYLLPKRTLIALSHAIEDECVARAERPVLFGSFQLPRFYRHAESRWRELARTAHAAIVFAEFGERRDPEGGPHEIPIEHDDPLCREWGLVCDAPDYAAFMAAWERPGQADVPDAERAFETIWSVEPELVREAARVAAAIAERTAPDVVGPVRERLSDTPPPAGEEFRVVGALTNRMVAYVGQAATSRLPAPHSSVAE
ncbi:MAG TPA: DICT sensory domain-containing protein [Thermoleophilaceae bacterium]